MAGFFCKPDGFDSNAQISILKQMTAAIHHRGPDGDGHWIDAEAGIALGHRRLAIIDLSEAGTQPMTSHCGRYVMVFNGEIYNYLELRDEVEARQKGKNWRGHSDTEVLLELIAEKGMDKTLKSLDAMFAIAVFDRKSNILTLARDAFGEKPLYYGYGGNTFLFGSELKAFRENPEFKSEIDQQALADYFKYSYVPSPATIYKDIFKLEPGSYLEIDHSCIEARKIPLAHRWWDMREAAITSRNGNFSGSRQEALQHLEEILERSTSRRMVSDVPLGALLSGGIDSSLVTAMMQRSSSRPVRTFSIGMDEPGFNEADQARAIADHLGTEHTELILSADQVQEVVPDIARIYDEPFSDSSQVPTFIVSRMARRDVTVALSGDGGDELFGGYNRYIHAPPLWEKANRLPAIARRAIARLAGSVPPGMVDRVVSAAGRFSPQELASGRAGEKLQKLARVLAAENRAKFHDNLLATSDDISIALSIDCWPQNLPERLGNRDEIDFLEQAMLTDTANYLPDDILTKVDRASMAVSLELRTPYLSTELFKLAWSLPQSFKVKDDKGKVLLRDLLYAMVPREIVDRPKAGFAFPVGRWLRGGLRDWAESGLSEPSLTDAGIFNVGEVRRKWEEHHTGKRDHETFLWSVLMYQGWREANTIGKVS